jgi:GH18 family chitinase
LSKNDLSFFIWKKSLLEVWAASGISKSKLLAGIPLYGRGWLLTSPNEHDLGASAVARIPASVYSKEAGLWSFREICQQISMDQASNIFDVDIGAAYAFTDTWWIGYNDLQTVKLKVSLFYMTWQNISISQFLTSLFFIHYRLNGSMTISMAVFTSGIFHKMTLKIHAVMEKIHS